MNTIYMNSKNNETTYPHRLLLNLTDKIKLKRNDKYFAFSSLSIYYTWKNMKTSYKNNKFKISAPTWTEDFEWPDGSYSVSDIQGYFEYIIKKQKTVTDNPSIKLYVNKIKKRITPFSINNPFLTLAPKTV